MVYETFTAKEFSRILMTAPEKSTSVVHHRVIVDGL
jgi:hypothetical protein